MNKVRAVDILKLLKQKHKEDVFISECKTGPTWGVSHFQKLDGWVMKKSWANPLTIGYEIKIGRQDFLNDTKWMGYLEYCNEFYFVSPIGLIQTNELPTEMGLYYVTKTGTKLYRKKKAVYRKVEIPEEIYRYLLMSRMVIASGNHYNSKEYWENWLKEKKVDYVFGHHVSKKIRETVKKEILDVKEENQRLKYANEKLGIVKEVIKKLGYKEHEINGWNFEERFSSRLKEVEQGISGDLINYIGKTIIDLGMIENILKKSMRVKDEKS